MTNQKSKILQNILLTVFILIAALAIVNFLRKSSEEVIFNKNIITDIKSSTRLPIVQGTLNGHKAYFLLDTGASVSILDLNQSKKYGFKSQGTSNDAIAGYGGVDTQIHEVSNVKVIIGDIPMVSGFNGKDIGYIVSGIQNITGYKVVGILGNNNISSAGFILDFNQSKIFLNEKSTD